MKGNDNAGLDFQHNNGSAKDMDMERNRTGADFIGVSTIILLTKALGFLRDVLIAAYIGTTVVADAYNQIFNNVPTLLFASIGIALSSVNIPNMTYYMAEKGERERKNYVSGLFQQITLISSAITILGIVLAPWISRLILPGMDTGMSEMAVSLTRIMFPIIIFICLAYITTSILQVHKHFLVSSAISIPFNLVIITALLIWKSNVLAIGFFTTLGWLLQFLVQVPVLKKEGYRLNLKLDLKNEHITATYKQLLPILLGNAALQLCIIVDTSFGSHLEGHTSALTYGSKLFMIITSIFIIAMSTVTFPDLSKYCLGRDYERLRKLIRYIFKVLSMILVPFIIIVIFYSTDIIELVYKRGAFDARSVELTAPAFLLYSLCVLGYVSQEVFNRVFYALKKFRIPAFLSLFCIILNFILVMVFYRPYGITGIAGATAVSFTIYAVLMILTVKREVGSFFGREYGSFLLKLGIPATGMTMVYLVFRYLGFSGMLKGFLLPLVLGGLVYLILAYFSGVLKDIVRQP